jgi:hypothetical protein
VRRNKTISSGAQNDQRYKCHICVAEFRVVGAEPIIHADITKLLALAGKVCWIAATGPNLDGTRTSRLGAF